MNNRRVTRRLSLFANEENTEGAGAAVTRYSTTGLCPVDVLEISILVNCFFNSVEALICYGCSCNKEVIAVQVVAVCKAILYIGSKALAEIAAVFLNNRHLAVLYLDAGLQTEQICAQSGNRGAATALNHILQSVKQEAGFYLGNDLLQLFDDLVQRFTCLGQLAGAQDNKALAGGQIPGVDNTDIIKFLSGQTGVLVAGREAGADVNVNDTVVLACIAAENIGIFLDIQRGSGAETATACHMGENVCSRNIDTITKILTILDNSQGHNRNVILFYQFLRKIAGAVRNDFDFHSLTIK